MNKIYFAAVFMIALFVFSTAQNAPASRIYIDIDSPMFRQIPIAVSPFTFPKGVPPKAANWNQALPQQIRFYLGLTGLFNTLNPDSFLQDADSAVTQGVDFASWAAIGADYLLGGEITTDLADIVAECRLYDITRGNVLLQKRYRGGEGDLLAFARAVASDIMLTLTGDPGDFDTRIAFVAKKGEAGDIHTVHYDGSDLTRITHHDSIVTSPRWSPDGQTLAFTSFLGDRPEVYLRDLRTGKDRKIVSQDGLNLSGGFSPDGRKLLLTLSRDGREEIYVLHFDSMRLERLTRSFSIDVSPTWSPDGRLIAFVSNRSGSPQIFIMDADGANVRRLTYEGNYNTQPAWSPSGDRIAYEGAIGGRFQIFSIDIEGLQPVQLTFGNENNEYPSWSPSGRQIVYASGRRGQSRIMIMTVNGLHNRVLVESGKLNVMPIWSPKPR